MTDPTRCRNGHPLEHPTVTVGWTGCGCEHHHRTWTCNWRDENGVRCGAVECHVTAARYNKEGRPPEGERPSR